MQKKLDERVRKLIQGGVKHRHRSLFVVIGDKYYTTTVNLFKVFKNALMKATPRVLWCYNKKLGLSSHHEKRLQQIKNGTRNRSLDSEEAKEVSLFIESVSHRQYRDSEKILGSTYGMCVLQDFEGLTPNILARTIDTVEGGGLVVILIHSLSTLTSLYAMVMDVHERFRTESHPEIVSRFNERFLLSLASCKACLVMDDEFNILPISSEMKSITRSTPEGCDSMLGAQKKLQNLKDQLNDALPVGPLIQICSTLDQGKCVSTLLDTILDKSVQSTIALTASRGRGKSAALGLAIAGAIAEGYSRIYVTAPSPENLKSLFDFVCRGLQALNYKEREHYELGGSAKPGFLQANTHINIYKDRKQFIQYIQPEDHVKLKLSQAELLVIDEAAAIPLPVVKMLLGPYLVFMSSTVNRYDETSHSLSLKLFKHLEKQGDIFAGAVNSSHFGRQFRKMGLKEPIRYSLGDPIESWLNSLLCLDASNSVPPISRFPHPTECNLYYVNRDTLFSFHKESEIFLQRMVALFVSSHYENSPNDLQLMADAPAHHLFVLLGPVDEKRNFLPDIFCVIQVCLEGEISRESVFQNLQKGRLPSGDQIPWRFGEKFGNTDFSTLSGVHIVKMAVHPNAIGQGYGSAALDLLTRYYEVKLTSIDEANVEDYNAKFHGNVITAAKEVSLLEETVIPRENLPPLLIHPRDRLPENVHYIGVSFGLNPDLFRFWKKHGYTPFYICNNPNSTTGEHSCTMLKPLETNDTEGDVGSLDFLTPFYRCFKRNFLRDLPLCFKELDYKLAMSILEPNIKFSENETSLAGDTETSRLVKLVWSPCDLKLLEGYANNQTSYEEVKRLQQPMAYWYFEEKFPISLSHLQASLLCMWLQFHDLTYIEEQMKIGKQQVLTLHRKVIVKFYKYFHDILTKDFDVPLHQHRQVTLEPHAVTVDEDLEDGAKEVIEKMRLQAEAAGKDEKVGILNPESLQRYAIEGREGEMEQALKRCPKIPQSGILSVKSSNKPNTKKRKGLEGTPRSKRSKR